MEALIARAVQILIALGGAYVLTLWFALVVWTFQDIQARSRSVVAQIFSTLVVMIFSIPGLLVYLILRPRYTLDDAFQRSLEEEYLMQDLEELPLCPGCQQYVEDEWVYCPNCRTELRDNCVACDQLIDLRWEICPYCGAEQYEDEELLPTPSMPPMITPSPQFLGRPQLNPAQAFQLAEHEDRTRPIIPATVRVDFRSGDIATEEAPALPISIPFRSLGSPGEPRRVTLDGANGVATDDDDLVIERNGVTGDLESESLDAEAPAVESEAAPDAPAPPDIQESVDDEAAASHDELQGGDPGSDAEVDTEPPKKRIRKRRTRGASQKNRSGESQE
jgi:RNA polymerase subunit RPABC4/transcription elongation factor Spt4